VISSGICIEVYIEVYLVDYISHLLVISGLYDTSTCGFDSQHHVSAAKRLENMTG